MSRYIAVLAGLLLLGACPNGMVVPPAPVGLAADSSIGEITLSWTCGATNEEGFIIESSKSSDEGFLSLGRAEQDSVSYVIENLEHGQTYYFRVCSYNAAGQSAYSDTVEASMSLSFYIQGDARATKESSVTLTSALAGMTQMRLSNDEITWSDWGPFAASVNWPLDDSEEGLKTVYAEYKDAAGAVIRRSDCILLDQTPPEIVYAIEINSGDDYTGSSTVTVECGVSGASNMRMASDAPSLLPEASWQEYTARFSWTMSGGEGARGVFVEFADDAGNSVTTGGAIIVDSTAPVVNDFKVQYASASTTTAEVTLNTAATIDSLLNSPAMMRFSNDNTTWGPWIAITTVDPTAPWVLDAKDGDGEKTVYAQYRDRAGNVKSMSDTILLDQSGPVGSFTINGGAASTNQRFVDITSSFSDARYMRFKNGDGDWPTTWQTYGSALNWNFPEGDGVKYVYGQFKDNHGNITVASDFILLDMYRTICVTFQELHVENGGDIYTSGDGCISIRVYTSAGAEPIRLAYPANEDGTAEIENNATYYVGQSATFAMRRTEGTSYRIEFYLNEVDVDDHETTVDAEYSYDDWGIRYQELLGQNLSVRTARFWDCSVTINYTIDAIE